MAKKDRRTGLTVEYSGKEIMEKLDLIHDQTKLTNGRVTLLEKKSIGIWISNNPFRFAIIIIAFCSIFISDLRQPAVKLFLGLFGL